VAVEARDRELSLVEHLGELRDRLIVAAIAVGITTSLAFVFATPIVRFLLVPVDCHWFTIQTRSLLPPDILVTTGLVCNEIPRKLIALSPTENFTTYFRVALFAGIALSMPVILYEIYAYIDPALYPKERRFVRLMGIPVILLFIIGMAFCYVILLPNAITFLINFGSEVIENQLRASDYLSFVTTFILGMGVVFEVPMIIYALVRVRVLRRSWLARQRRYVFLIVFVAAAVLTPTPDPFNQTLVALPMYLLFEMGLLLARFAGEPRAAT
jgi:sec-independent protein translocase protein TatC